MHYILRIRFWRSEEYFLVLMGIFVLNFRNMRRIAALLAVVATGLLFAPETALAETATSKRSASRKPVHKAVRKAVKGTPHHSARLKSHAVRRTTTRAGVIHTGTAATVRTSTSRRRRTRRALYNPWTEPTYADSTVGDNVDGDDPVVRKAAIDALGLFNGTVVVTDPQTGRILTMVNQKLGLKGAFQPCST